MGVKHFYLWYKKNFDGCITHKPSRVDTLAIDLNGLFHLCAQRIYRYGNVSALLLQKNHGNANIKTNVVLFKEICTKIERLRSEIQPRKRLLLCVDGVAGLGKMNQQRQRRFKTGLTMDVNAFNPNSFTPGTKLMDHLTKYIDWYIRSMITTHKCWQDLEVIFSNEKVPGEGEHKIMQYIRHPHNTSPSETICVYGLDADLVMIGLLLEKENVYIAREPEYGFMEFVSLTRFRKEILTLLQFEGEYRDVDAINDFILMTFLVGNDFVPTLPTISILDGAFDIFIEIYRDNGQSYGHLTECDRQGNVVFRLNSLASFFVAFSKKEKSLIEKKYNSQHAFFPDPLVLRNLRIDQQRNVIHFEKYRKDYYESKLPAIPIDRVVTSYLDGMNWILNYYKSGIPDWTWFYPYFYAPFLVDFAERIQHYENPHFSLHEPVDPFLQLIMVLPESSKQLLPLELSDVATHLKQFFPDIIEIDLTGKRKEWEGVVILPIIELTSFQEYYEARQMQISASDKKRNIRGKNFMYKFNPMKREQFSSFYGNIYDCPVTSTIIHF